MIRLAPRFGTKAKPEAISRVAIYAFTPVWIAGAIGIVPAASLLVLAGYGYAVHLLRLGSERLLGTPSKRSLQFAGASVGAVCIGVFVLHRLLSAAFGGGAPF